MTLPKYKKSKPNFKDKETQGRQATTVYTTSTTTPIQRFNYQLLWEEQAQAAFPQSFTNTEFWPFI